MQSSSIFHGAEHKQTSVLAVQVRFFCNAMPWVDCTALRYHCTKLPDVDLCPEAFADGRFPPGCTARDFIKLTGARAPQVSHPPALHMLPACGPCDGWTVVIAHAIAIKQTARARSCHHQ